jgi:hypothetical protein
MTIRGSTVHQGLLPLTGVTIAPPAGPVKNVGGLPHHCPACAGPAGDEPETRTIRGVDRWLTAARDALAETASISREELELDDEDERTLLGLARIAAHVSGERTNAPLLCYLVGRAQGDATLDELAAAVRGTEA